MYITKINHITDNQLKTNKISPSKHTYHRQNILNSRISKKDSFILQRTTKSDRSADNHEYSDSFRQMMNQVLNRICKKNNFLRIKKRKQFVSLNQEENQNNTDSQIYQSISLDDKINRENKGLSKLKIQGIGRAENDSNLLKKKFKPRIYNKTSVSFVKNKQFRKSIDLKKAKSMPSYGKIGSVLQKEQQNQSFLNNLHRITFNNSFYSKVNQIKNAFGQICKVDTIIPKFQMKENYRKMQDVFEKELEPEHKKIERAKKLFHKKMVERQRHNERYSQSFIQKQKLKVMLIQKNQQKNEFEPWITHEDIPEDILKVQKSFPA